MLRNERISWLENKKILGQKKLGGRKRFGVYKNQQSFVLGDRDSSSVRESPDLNQIYGRAERGEEMGTRSRRLVSNIKLRPLDEEGVRKALQEREVEIYNLKRLYKDVADRISVIERSHRSEVQVDIQKPRMDKTKANEMVGFSFRNRSQIQSPFTKKNPKLVLTNPITGINSLKNFK